MKFREMLESDIDYMAGHSVSKGVFDKIPCQLNFAYAVEDENGVLLGVGGVQLINSTTAWAWVDIAEGGKDRMKNGYRIIRDWMEKLVEIHELKRLQAYVRTDFPEAIRMAEHLGFHKESVMEKFINDKDAYLYARIM